MFLNSSEAACIGAAWYRQLHPLFLDAWVGILVMPIGSFYGWEEYIATNKLSLILSVQFLYVLWFWICSKFCGLEFRLTYFRKKSYGMVLIKASSLVNLFLYR